MNGKKERRSPKFGLRRAVWGILARFFAKKQKIIFSRIVDTAAVLFYNDRGLIFKCFEFNEIQKEAFYEHEE